MGPGGTAWMVKPYPSHQGHREYCLLHEPADGFQESAAGARTQSAATEPQAATADPPEPGDPAQREWRTAERRAGVQVAVPEPPLELPHRSRAPPLRQDRQPRWVPRKATLPGLREKAGSAPGHGRAKAGKTSQGCVIKLRIAWRRELTQVSTWFFPDLAF